SHKKFSKVGNLCTYTFYEPTNPRSVSESSSLRLVLLLLSGFAALLYRRFPATAAQRVEQRSKEHKHRADRHLGAKVVFKVDDRDHERGEFSEVENQVERERGCDRGETVDAGNAHVSFSYRRWRAHEQKMPERRTRREEGGLTA